MLARTTAVALLLVACDGHVAQGPGDGGASSNAASGGPAPVPPATSPSPSPSNGMQCEGPNICGYSPGCQAPFELGEACTVPWSCDLPLTCGPDGKCVYKECTSPSDCDACDGHQYLCDGATGRCALAGRPSGSPCTVSEQCRSGACACGDAGASSDAGASTDAGACTCE
jgi:hypothetical protein